MGCLLSREKPPIDSRKTNTLEIEIQSHNNGMGDPEFTEVQKQLVKTTWDVVRDDISKVGVITFLRFVSYIYDFLLLKICFVSLVFYYYYYFFNAIFAIQSSSQSQTFVYNMHVHIHVLTLINLTIGLYSTCAYGLRNTVGLTLRYWGCTSFDKTSKKKTVKKKTVNESSGVEESTQIVSAEFQNEMFQSMIKFIQYYPLTNIKERNVQFQG